MKEIFEAINEYPWTTFFVWVMIMSVVAIYKDNDKND